MVDIYEISAVVAAAGVIVGVVYYILDMRHQSKVRETDVIIRMNPSFNVSLVEWQQAAFKVANLQYNDYDDFVKKYGSLATDTPTIMAIHTISNFYEGIAYLLKRKLVVIDYVWDCYGEAVIMLWEKLKPVVEGFRKQYNVLTAWRPVEYLYDEMKKREQRKYKILLSVARAKSYSPKPKHNRKTNIDTALVCIGATVASLIGRLK